MCGGSETVSQNTTSTATATPQEQAMEQIQLGEMQSYSGAQQTMYNTAFSTGNNLLNAVNQPNSQQWQTLLGGITPQQTQSQVNTQDQALQGSLQQAGIYNSGTASSGRMQAATQLSNTNAQFNVGTLQNALNLALSGQAQVQSTASSNSSQLGQELAGLRTTTTSGTSVYPSSGVNLGIFGSYGGSYYGGCWVASEVFNEPMDGLNTSAARFYIGTLAPIWFSKFYLKFGQRIALFIHNKPLFKAILRPLFESFVRKTQVHVRRRAE